ncbi:bacitracin transport system permease protein [Halobacillus alkaliphilus]|uniref:Bacitracin transport system permease protein n=1 Tax=Halobacillus alkaliphilus TaxID=396056 RepID=A0A1I2KG34_9BACI|nr:ABC transporter permease [Halobacillus alkaliphilus]SFF64197.1 bacitracin transport system permease protein [Halobacillus alkaliphilus]
MNINQIIFRNLKKNLKNYYLYVFALIFSVALYFAFVTLQYDPAMDSTKGTLKGGAAVRTASVLLIGIVAVFLVYANNIFIKRRSKEIGMFQLIGLTKNRIFRILSAENLIIYFGSLIVGIFLGFAASKLILMILFQITDVETAATLRFSFKAMVQTLGVFGGIYVLIMGMNYLFIQRQTILSLFRTSSKTEGKVGRISLFEIIMGILGLGLIATGYYVSSQLFSGATTSMNSLFGTMIFILASVIIGTYFFYKGSVRFVANIIRKNKQGYMNINEVLSLSSVMFRMKSNAMLLTIITTVSALAIALLSLSYISYYSAENSAGLGAPNDFSFVTEGQAEEFTEKLDGIPYTEEKIDVLRVAINVEDIVEANMEDLGGFDAEEMTLSVIKDTAVEGIDVGQDQTIFTGFYDALQRMMQLEDSGELVFKGKEESFNLNFLGVSRESVLSGYFSGGGMPTAVVDETVYNQLSQDLNPDIQGEYSQYIGINLESEEQVEEADEVFQSLALSNEVGTNSRYATTKNQKQNMGLIMFIVGFLGLTFLITSGCILYFKQMDEGEEERPNYTILRKLGYTNADLLRGIQGKQVFNFGIPLLVGLLHSYFAVQSGWFFFGTELWIPMFIVMGLYTGLYSIFSLLSVLYYKRIIKEAL